MDSDSSTKFIGSLTKFLQSLCNGYVEFDTGVELIGHIYLSVDTGKKIDYILNEKVCKSDNSVTFISNSFHALPAEKLKPPSNKKSTLEEKNLDKENKKEDGEIMIVDSGDSAPHSSNTGTVSTRSTTAARSTASPNQTRTSSISGTKRPGSPLTPRRAPTPPQRRPSTPPSQRRSQLSGAKGPVGSPGSSKPTVPSSPSSSSQDNIPSPASRLLNRNENIAAQPNSQPSTDNAGGESESDTLIPASILSVNPDLSSFLGTISGRENQSISLQEQRPDLTDDDTKPDTDVTFIKEEFPTSPPSCAQAGNSGQSAGRSVEDQLTDSGSSSGLFPVMLHQNTAAFSGSNAGFPQGFPQLGGTASSSQRSGFNQPIPSTSTSQSTADLFANPVPGTSHSSQDGGASDPSVLVGLEWTSVSDFNPATGISCIEEIKSIADEVMEEQLNCGIFARKKSFPGGTFPKSLFGHFPKKTANTLQGTQKVVTPFIDEIAMSAINSRLDEDIFLGNKRKCVQCRHCGQVISHARNLRRHEDVCRQNVTVHPCDFCDATYTRHDTLRKHLRDKHGVGEKLACQRCSMPFRSKAALDKHCASCEIDTSDS